MKVLGFESSCDETGIAIYDSDSGLLGQTLHSQIDLHAQYGGVVPELASRDHIRFLLPLTEQLFSQAGIRNTDIDGIAYTAGPGLIGALLVGAASARSMAWAWDIPAVEVHHMEGHMLAPMMSDDAPDFPFIALLVSGGHTQLVHVEAIGKYSLLGESLDDAAGEAFDKTAKMLGLPYPGGPELAKLAKQGNEKRFHFPRPMTNRPGLDFSFSGLKTFAINTWQKEGDDEQTRADIARAFEDAVVDTLLIKCRRAIRETGIKRLVIAGGVSANYQLRSYLTKMVKGESARVYFPEPELCTDNGAMIAYAGCLRLMAGESTDNAIHVRARWPLEELA